MALYVLNGSLQLCQDPKKTLGQNDYLKPYVVHEINKGCPYRIM